MSKDKESKRESIGERGGAATREVINAIYQPQQPIKKIEMERPCHKMKIYAARKKIFCASR